MDLWSKEEFNKVSENTRISERTLKACFDVLCRGMQGAEAAARHDMLPAQVSRGVSTLRERRAQIEEHSEQHIANKATMRAAAVALARELTRDRLVETPSQPGLSYAGQVLVKLDDIIVQRQGNYAVVHELGKLERSPAVNEFVTIKYSKNEGLAKVKTVNERQAASEQTKERDKSGRGR